MLSNEETMLTDDEILAQWSGSDEAVRPVMGSKKVLSFARAILAAHTAKLLAGVEMPEAITKALRQLIYGDFCADNTDDLNMALELGPSIQQYAAAAAAQAREKALDEAIVICHRNAQSTSGDEIEKLKGGE